jgi:hypothetical protein
MRFLSILIVISYSGFIYSCSNCIDPASDPPFCDRQSYIYYKIDSVQQNDYRFDSVDMVYPKQVKIKEYGRIPVSYEANTATLVLYKSGRGDTLILGYKMNYQYSEECDEHYFSIFPINVISTTLSNKFRVALSNCRY